MRKVFVDIKLESGVLTPDQLPALLATVGGVVSFDEPTAIIVSGRLPVWCFGALVHWAHPAQWIATFDPRLGGGVVVASHIPGVKVGDVVSVDDAQKVSVTF